MTRKQLRHWALWSALLFGCASALLGLFYYRTYAFPGDGLAQLFITLALPGHFIFFCFVLSLPGLLLCQLFPRPRLLLLVSGLLLTGFLVVLVTDIKVFGLFRFHLDAMAWRLLTGGAAGDIFEFSAKDYLLSLLLFVGVLLLSVLCWLAARKLALSSRRWGWPVFLLTVLVMGGGQVLYAWSDAIIYQPVLRQLRVIPWAQPLTAKRFFEKRGWVDPQANTVKVSMPGVGAMNYPKSGFACPAKPAEEQKNLLVIMVDTLRHDLLTPEVMPATRALAEQGQRYTRHYSTSNATRFGVFGFFYGLYGSYWHAALSENRPPALLQVMQEQGYEFGVFASARLTSPEFDRTVFAGVQGDIFLSTPGADKASRDIKANQRFKTFIEQRSRKQTERPFFGFLFYDAAHGYAYPDGFKEKFTPAMDKISYVNLNKDSDPEPLLNRYKNSLYFIDGLIAEAIDSLRAAGELDNTVIVITSDHGQEFNDSGGNYWGHNSSYSQWQTRVPMAIVYPGQAPAVYTHLTSHVDVVPTLFKNLLGCTPELSTYTQGHYMDAAQGHDFLLFNSWSRFGYYDTQRYVVMHRGGLMDVYDQDYQLQEGEAPDPQTLMKIMQLNSEFLN